MGEGGGGQGIPKMMKYLQNGGNFTKDTEIEEMGWGEPPHF